MVKQKMYFVQFDETHITIVSIDDGPQTRTIFIFSLSHYRSVVTTIHDILRERERDGVLAHPLP